MKQCTLNDSFKVHGKGLHTGLMTPSFALLPKAMATRYSVLTSKANL